MATVEIVMTDTLTRDTVQQQLEWDPAVDARAIGVSAQGGTVTLTGYINTYAGKLAAERAAKRVRGVRGVANDIDVRPMLARTDTEIAQDAVRVLDLRESVPDTVQAVVHNGHITLTGTVAWLFQKRQAEKAVAHIKGIRGVFNHIAVASGAAVSDVQQRIVQALRRHADVDARCIAVAVSGDVAVLTGTVASWTERDAAEHAAADAPGIARVENRIAVESPPAEVDELC